MCHKRKQLKNGAHLRPSLLQSVTFFATILLQEHYHSKLIYLFSYCINLFTSLGTCKISTNTQTLCGNSVVYCYTKESLFVKNFQSLPENENQGFYVLFEKAKANENLSLTQSQR